MKRLLSNCTNIAQQIIELSLSVYFIVYEGMFPWLGYWSLRQIRILPSGVFLSGIALSYWLFVNINRHLVKQYYFTNIQREIILVPMEFYEFFYKRDVVK